MELIKALLNLTVLHYSGKLDNFRHCVGQVKSR